MPRVHVTGWRRGMEKLSTIQLLRAHLGLGMAEAKGLVDAILEGRELRLEAATDGTAEELAAALRELGVEATAEPDA
jgi:ribosomal protein L7/L12